MIILIMKKITTALSLGLITLANAAPAFAQAGVGVSKTITPFQPSGITAGTDPSVILKNVTQIIFTVAILLVLFYLILGAFNWITSGGDKEKIKGARGTIIHALVGLAILALAFVIMTVAGNILNVSFTNVTLPGLGTP